MKIGPALGGHFFPYIYTVRPRLFDNPLFAYPALFEVDRRSRFYLYIKQYKYERIIRNELSEYLLFFEVKFRSRLYNYERISHLLFEASLIIIRSQTNWRRSTRWPADLWKISTVIELLSTIIENEIKAMHRVRFCYCYNAWRWQQ
jgi:hypothetical protein